MHQHLGCLSHSAWPFFLQEAFLDCPSSGSLGLCSCGPDFAGGSLRTENGSAVMAPLLLVFSDSLAKYKSNMQPTFSPCFTRCKRIYSTEASVVTPSFLTEKVSAGSQLPSAGSLPGLPRARRRMAIAYLTPKSLGSPLPCMARVWLEM